MPDQDWLGPALVSMAQEFTGLPMDSLIGGPLNAAANANAAMALTQTKFLLDTCFTKTGTAPSYAYSPIMVKMTLDRPVIVPPDTEGGTPTIKKIETAFNLPLLTIIPLNSLAVDSVDIIFEMEVKSSYLDETTKTRETDRKTNANVDTKLGWSFLSVTLKASVSYDQKDSSTHNTHYEKSNSAKYTVNVHAGQLPMPKGVNTIIDVFTKAIEPIQPTQLEEKKPKP